MIPGYNETLILWLNLVGTFVFGLSGGLAATKARLDLFGVIVLAAVVGLAGGITRDLLIGVPPATFRDWRYLAAVGAAGVVSFYAPTTVERAQRGVLFFDALGLSVFCVAGASKALDHHLGPVQAVLLGAITAIGGGMLRDIILRDVPLVLRKELYAIPALLGAAIVVAAYKTGHHSPAYPLIGAAVCMIVRLAGLRFNLNIPIAPEQRHEDGERSQG